MPEIYEWAEERVMVKPASERIVEVPAVYETVKETIVDRPAHTVWQKGTGPIQRVDYATGEIMCLVEVPATYKTVTKTVVKTPATARRVKVPAEYTVVRKQVIKTPSTTREVMVPAEYKDVNPEAGFSCRTDAGSDSRRATERHEDGCGERRAYGMAAGALRNQCDPCGDQINAASPAPGGALRGKIDGKLTPRRWQPSALSSRRKDCLRVTSR